MDSMNSTLDTFNIEGMLVSAKKYIGIEELLESICKNIFMDYIKCKVMVPYKDGKMTSSKALTAYALIAFAIGAVSFGIGIVIPE